VIRFIDMRELDAEARGGSGARFAFWDTNREHFTTVSVWQAWKTWADFEAGYRARYFEGSPYKAAHVLEAYRRACPAWVFEAAA
jgi:hypothetical protein